MACSTSEAKRRLIRSAVRGVAMLVALASAAVGGGDARAAGTAARAEAWTVVAEIAGDFVTDGRDPGARWALAEGLFGAPTAHHAAFQAMEPEILLETHYDRSAREHLLRHGLNQRATLERLRERGPADAAAPASRGIPGFPAGATMLLTAWWPVARDGDTPLPVWDPEHNPPRAAGNHYLTWPRVLAVSQAATPAAARAGRDAPPPVLDFAGRRVVGAARVDAARFVQREVDAALARRSREDPRLRKAAALALGRPLEAGDRLLLVALHFARKRGDDWQWGTVWWHDASDAGPFAAGRPAGLVGAWRNYLLDTPDVPAAPDARGAAAQRRPVFNPWLEARFADGGAGPGVGSDCASCHRRASYPDPGFLPVTRDPPDLLNDPAFAAGQLGTDFIWSIPRRTAVR